MPDSGFDRIYADELPVWSLNEEKDGHLEHLETGKLFLYKSHLLFHQGEKQRGQRFEDLVADVVFGTVVG